MSGIYSTNTAKKLFEKLILDFKEFSTSPSEYGIFNVIFPLYHLREWICPGGYKSYKNKPEKDLLEEEKLHRQLHTIEEYKIVRGLCNNAKHYNDDGMSERTSVVEGARAGMAICGDSIGVTHFMVDRREIREIFWEVYIIYFNYFKGPNI